MKYYYFIICKGIIVWIVILFFTINPMVSFAIDENKIERNNILITSGLTLIRGYIEGNIDNWKDAFKCLFWGAAAGEGFYKSKEEMAKGNIGKGYLIANLSHSLVENVARGEHPLSYLGYYVGPIRFNVSTPFAKKPTARIIYDISLLQMGALVVALQDAEHISFKDGLYVLHSDDNLGLIEGTTLNSAGQTYGIFPTMGPNLTNYDQIYRHEAVHVVQYIQVSAVSYEPFLNREKYKDNILAFKLGRKRTLSDESDKRKSIPLIRFGGWRLETANIQNLYLNNQKYQEKWTEKEAYRMVQKSDPPE